MIRLSDIIWAFWGFNCASNFVFLRPFLFCKGICKVHRCNGLEILVPKHLWKSKIGPIQLIWATKCYVTFLLGHPVHIFSFHSMIVSTDKLHPQLCANLSSSKLIGKLWKKCMYLPSFKPCIFDVGIMRIWKKSHIETIPLPYHTQQTEIRIVGLLMIRYSPRCFTFLVNHIK